MSNHIILEDSRGQRKSYQIAGLGGRAYAFAIDWHIRFVLALLVLGIYFVTHMPHPFDIGVLGHFDFSWSRWAALAVFLLYHPVLEIAMDGTTPGKRLARIRIVDQHCNPASVAALLGRNLLRPFDAFPLVYTIGILFVFFSKRAVRLGDMMAQTMLIYTHRVQEVNPEAAPIQETSAKDLDAILDLLKRWNIIGQDRRVLLATQILQKLGRSVPLGVADQQLERRLRAHLKSIAQQHGHEV